MKKLIIVFVFLSTLLVNAQHTISGTFSPSKDYTWLIAYRLKPGTQVYTADTEIRNGEFNLEFPENATPGTYRMVYAVPQEEFYFDVIYNGKEDIFLSFNSDQGPLFSTSKENILFGTYFKEIQDVERDLIAFYSEASSDVRAYRKILKKYQEVQSSYEKRSVGSIANQFIIANKPYIPSDYESIQQYVAHRKKSYFDALDFTNSTLQASGFLTDKITNYVFTSLPLEHIEKADTEKAIQANVDTIFKKLTSVSDDYRFHIGYNIWTQSSASDFNETADYIFSHYLKKSPSAITNQEIINNIEIHNRLRIGAIAPEISWKKGASLINLSALKEAKNYILIFWSSTCGHCLKELPALHKELKKYPNVTVIAVGLEDNDTYWQIESKKLENFEHVIALGKWDSKYADLYNIQSTPTYFILDADKHIIATPESDKEVVEFLKEKGL